LFRIKCFPPVCSTFFVFSSFAMWKIISKTFPVCSPHWRWTRITLFSDTPCWLTTFLLFCYENDTLSSSKKNYWQNFNFEFAKKSSSIILEKVPRVSHVSVETNNRSVMALIITNEHKMCLTISTRWIGGTKGTEKLSAFAYISWFVIWIIDFYHFESLIRLFFLEKEKSNWLFDFVGERSKKVWSWTEMEANIVGFYAFCLILNANF
jgi:hypothetical protein